MSGTSLDDLRATLDGHAETLPDDALARVVSVHERVRVVRRRRRTTAGVAAAAVLVAGFGLGGRLLGGGDTTPEPAGPPAEVAGQRIPDRVTVLGGEYAYSDAVEIDVADGTFTDRLRRDDANRAVALVGSGLGEGWATLEQDGNPLTRALAAEQAPPAVLVGEHRSTLRVRLHDVPAGAQVGLAFYDRTATPHDGVALPDGTAWFRQVVDDVTLRKAEFSDPGQGELTLTVSAALGDLQVADFCRTEATGLWVKVSIDGDGWSGGQCQPSRAGADEAVDAGASHFTTASSQDVRQHSLRIYVTRGARGREVVSDPTTTIGLGLYDVDERDRVLGTTVARTVDWDGRRWVLDRVVDAGTAHGVVDRLPAGDRPVLAGIVVRRGAGAALDLRGETTRSADVGTSFLSPISTAQGLQGQLLPGEAWRIGVRQMDRERPSRVAVLLYRPVA